MIKESPTTPLTRTLEEAERWTKNWQTKNPKISKAFRIPADDLIACFNEMDIQYSKDKNGKLHIVIDKYEPAVRAYLAIDDDGGEKLLIVGTTTENGEDYKDIVKDEKKVDADGLLVEASSGVYDFTTPCPNDCDQGSPLNHD